MLRSLTTLQATQAARRLSIPVEARESPASAAFLEAFRRRNTALDSLFYDVSAVSETEAASLAPWLAREGAILSVPPDGEGEISVFASPEAFINGGGQDIRVLAVAGVGSSALGTAAFARNIANGLGQTTAAVVSGYGLADLATEALGGYFLFGMLNGLRHAFQSLERQEQSQAADIEIASNPARQSIDTLTVMNLLADNRARFETVIGHSKGNLVISEAMYALSNTDPARAAALGASIQFVTVSARIALPPVCKNVLDVMGALDWFGEINSRPSIKPDIVVPNAWHHTNRELPASLRVPEMLLAARQAGFLRIS
ncbi:MAG: hypothetical protein ACKVP5_09975 [Aestuariivirga sp.]